MPSRRRVLVVDDDPCQRDTTAEILEHHGYAIATAANGWEALELAMALSPALILLDLEMPIMTGWELLAALRRSAALRDIPVIVLTGHSETPAEVTCFVKPVHTEALLESIDRAVSAELRRRSAAAALADAG